MATSALSFSPSSNPRILPAFPRPTKFASFSSRAASFTLSSASRPSDAEDLTAAGNSASPSSSCSSSLVSASFTGRRTVLGAGIGLLASAAVASDANATRIEYYATVGDPLCDLSYARSGLGFCEVAVGDGPEPPRGELINIHYTARFADGTVFDSSYKRGRPLTLRIGVGKVLPGLDQGILGGGGVPPMLVGGKRKLLIPPKLGYGPEPAGCFSGDCNIPGNATLLYDILFVGIYK